MCSIHIITVVYIYTFRIQERVEIYLRRFPWKLDAKIKWLDKILSLYLIISMLRLQWDYL